MPSAPKRLTPERLEEIRRANRDECDVRHHNDDLEDVLDSHAALEAEIARLNGVLRGTHEHYCTSAWTDRGLHAPECLLFEIGAENE